MQETKSALDIALNHGERTEMKLVGQADFHNRHQLQEVFDALLSDGHTTVHADLSDLHYVDSSGLSTLVNCAIRANEAGGAIELTGVSVHVARLLTLCGAAMFFTSREHAVPVCHENETRQPAENFWHVSDFSLPASPAAAAQARGRVAEVVRSLPMTLTERQDVLLAVGEALANAIRHGCACDQSKRITVKCVAGPRRLTIDIIDPGNGFNPEAIGPPQAHKLGEGGMGIYMMRELMDEVEFIFDGTTSARLVKHLSCPAMDGDLATAAPTEEYVSTTN